jgi:hypothetical protein
MWKPLSAFKQYDVPVFVTRVLKKKSINMLLTGEQNNIDSSCPDGLNRNIYRPSCRRVSVVVCSCREFRHSPSHHPAVKIIDVQNTNKVSRFWKIATHIAKSSKHEMTCYDKKSRPLVCITEGIEFIIDPRTQIRQEMLRVYDQLITCFICWSALTIRS